MNHFIFSVLDLFSFAQKEPSKYICSINFRYFAIHFMKNTGEAKLIFIENLEYKFLELLGLEFDISDEETIRQNISFRFNSLKVKTSLTEGKLKNIFSMIKLKNPSLLLQLQKKGNEKSTMSHSQFFK